ncbi:MAG: pseudaminic acid synthase [Ardenticatenaceae bacterium]|nr:pseudaminic acid synthase [Ardenticatenaceae bacterium]
MKTHIKINGRRIGPNEPTYVIAEMSANHNHDFELAVKILEAAKESGADAVKLQTYTADTLTIDCDNPYFRIEGTIWEGKNLYDLYGEAYTPWDWQPKLKEIANSLGMDLFSTPFDETAVTFLEQMDVPAYKVASFENVDLPLLRRIAQTGKPIIMSNGMATLAELDEAVQTLYQAGATELALLKCVSSYPARPEDMNLRTIPNLAQTFGVPVGLSDHSMDIAVPVTAVALGACIIEKHFTLSRNMKGPDSEFSLEPDEFKQMVAAVRTAEQALGKVQYGPTQTETKSKNFRRSLFVVEDIASGEPFTTKNVRSIRPGHGLHTRYLPDVLGKKASKSVKRGTPVTWDLLSHG